MSRYDDIINLDHFEPKRHPRMSVYNRSAQFSPFAALNGYEDAISETGRLTNEKLELDEYQKAEVNATLQFLKDNNNESFTIIYFLKDNIKSGGQYISVNTSLKKLDEDNHLLLTTDGNTINIDDIYTIELN